MSAQYWGWLLAVLAMGAVTFLLRAAPVLLPKAWLKSALLHALNFALPLSVMTLLILASLSLNKATAQPLYLAAEILALLCVWLSYRQWRNVLVSMIIGGAALNGWLWVLGAG